LSAEPQRAVISASRRTDLPHHFPGWLATVLRRGWVDVPQPYGGKRRYVSLRPEEVHTIVLWSKDFSPVLRDESGVRSALARYDQIFCHLTITGLGGTGLEPGVPTWEEVVAQLPALVDWAGDPRRVTVRFDPILHWFEDSTIHSNLPFAEPIFDACAQAGIQTVRISFATIYPKLAHRGYRWYDPPLEERLKIARRLVALARERGITLLGCCQPELMLVGIQPSSCIDGALLSALHPKGYLASTARDRGQRRGCRCTRSIDIGSYQMRCPSGCRYCYAQPLLHLQQEGSWTKGD